MTETQELMERWDLETLTGVRVIQGAVLEMIDGQKYEVLGFTKPSGEDPFGLVIVRRTDKEIGFQSLVPTELGCRITQRIDSRESLQTKRYRWRECASAFYVDDTGTGVSHCMGDMVDQFGDPETMESLAVGTQKFYDALNMWFEGCQDEIAEAYFNR